MCHESCDFNNELETLQVYHLSTAKDLSAAEEWLDTSTENDKECG